MTGDREYNQKYDSWPSGEYPPDWDERRKLVLKRDKYRCQNCGKKSLPENDLLLDIDHIKPKSESGSHSLDNLRCLCQECHAKRHPNNKELRRRSGIYPLWLRLVLLPMKLLSSDSDSQYTPEKRISDISGVENRVTVEVEVSQLWEPYSESMQQVGLISDGTENIKFVSWKGNDVTQVEEGIEYLIEYASVDTYEGDPEIELDTFTEVSKV